MSHQTPTPSPPPPPHSFLPLLPTTPTTPQPPQFNARTSGRRSGNTTVLMDTSSSTSMTPGPSASAADSAYFAGQEGAPTPYATTASEDGDSTIGVPEGFEGLPFPGVRRTGEEELPEGFEGLEAVSLEVEGAESMQSSVCGGSVGSSVSAGSGGGSQILRGAGAWTEGLEGWGEELDFEEEEGWMG